MKKIWKKEIADTLWFLSACFVLGMTAGIIFANLVYPHRTGEMETMAVYIMQQLKDGEISSPDYFGYLLRFRGKRIFGFMILSLSAIAPWMSVCAMIWMGVLFGTLSSLIILQFGLQGFLLLIVGLLPQILLYVPVTWLMMAVIYGTKGRILKKPKEMQKTYFLWMGLCVVGYLFGIVLEGYVNMPLLQLFVKKYDF